jgi:hypothetical protein
MNLSRNNQPSSNLNCVWFPADDDSPIFWNNGVWSEMSHVKACTVDKENFCPHSVASVLHLVSHMLDFVSYLPM